MVRQIKRCEKQHYINTGTEAEPVWSLIGEGFVRFEERKKPVVREKRYIHEACYRSDVIGYSPEVIYEAEMLYGVAAVELIASLTDREAVGEDAVVEVLTVDRYAPTEVSGVFPAIKRRYTVLPDRCTPPGDELIFTGTLAGYGEAQAGRFVWATAEFVAD